MKKVKKNNMLKEKIYVYSWKVKLSIYNYY